AVVKYGKDIMRNPIGTGPFRFVSWVKDDRVEVVRNDDYWGDKAYLDKVVIRPIPEAEGRVIALESGDVQLAIRLNPEHLARLEKHERVTTILRGTNRTLFFGMAALKKPFSDLRVRQALNHAIDKESIVKNLYLGMAQVNGGAVSPGAADYVAVPGLSYDPARARRLLAEAGYPNGFSTTLVGPRGNYVKDFELQQAVQQQLRAVGVDAKLETVEFAKYLELLRMDPTKSPLEMWLDAWGGGNAADEIENRFGCEYFRPKGANTAGFCDPAISKLAQDALRITDEARRQPMLKEAQERISQQAPAIWVLALKQIAGLSRKLHDPVFMQSENLTVDEHTWLEA
ncbi:MAG: hypothetical protein FJ034_08450, partial [Chloroflexi bacterium]|nr:hypothetical protein [Chloroflexota bacterium]